MTADAAATAGISTSMAHPVTNPCLFLPVITIPLASLFPHFQCSVVYFPSLAVHTSSLFHAVIISLHTERKKEAVIRKFGH